MATTERTRSAVRLTLALIAAAGLAIDAYVHFDLASTYAPIKSSVLNQGDLFRGAGVVAAIAAAAVLLRPRRYTAAFAFLVAAAGTAAVLVYAYVDLGAFGPFPDMYDPLWFGEKTLSVVAEGVGALAALALFALLHAEARRENRVAAHSGDHVRGAWPRTRNSRPVGRASQVPRP
jgi:hypothetical protein